jgi:hypothetical protein
MPAAAALAPRTTEEVPVRERTSTPLTLARFASVNVADAANASVSLPKPPTIESFPSRVELAIEKRSLPDPPTNVVESVSD